MQRRHWRLPTAAALGIATACATFAVLSLAIRIDDTGSGCVLVFRPFEHTRLLVDSGPTIYCGPPLDNPVARNALARRATYGIYRRCLARRLTMQATPSHQCGPAEPALVAAPVRPERRAPVDVATALRQSLRDEWTTRGL